jgi:hypothetical protein
MFQWVRYTLLVVILLTSQPVVGQLDDVAVVGYFMDANTGDTIPVGKVEWVGVNGYQVSGESMVSPYSGMDLGLFYGTDQMLFFSAHGYTTRMAEIDLGARSHSAKANSLLEVHMDVLLTPLVDTLRPDTNRQRLGKCVLSTGKVPLKWTTEQAALVYPIVRRTDEQRKERLRRLRETPPSVQVAIYGNVRDEWSLLPIENVKVLIKGSDGTLVESVTDKTGFFRCALFFDRSYRIEYRSEGRLSKIVDIDTQGIPSADRRGGFGMNIEIRLFADIEGEDLSFLQQPIGKAAFSYTTHWLAWDLDYSASILERLQTILKRHRP